MIHLAAVYLFFALFILKAHAQFNIVTMKARPDSYIVLTAGTTTGSFGGLTGANALCLSQLQSYNFKGKDSIASLTSANVKAFLCDGSSCYGLRPNTRYIFATANSAGTGGASFTTDASGYGPGNANSWSVPDHFGVGAYWWSGRSGGSNFDNSSIGDDCTSWTSSAATNGGVGMTNSTSGSRWASSPQSCSSNLRLICIVDP